MLIDIPVCTLRDIIAKYLNCEPGDEKANPELYDLDTITEIITDISTVL